MPTLQWSDTLTLGLPAMDATHHEFVDLMAQVVNAPDETLLPQWRGLVAHTDDHFARAGHGRRADAAPAQCRFRPGHGPGHAAASLANRDDSWLWRIELLERFCTCKRGRSQRLKRRGNLAAAVLRSCLSVQRRKTLNLAGRASNDQMVPGLDLSLGFSVDKVLVPTFDTHHGDAMTLANI